MYVYIYRCSPFNSSAIDVTTLPIYQVEEKSKCPHTRDGNVLNKCEICTPCEHVQVEDWQSGDVYCSKCGEVMGKITYDGPTSHHYDR